jgi:hypothetical protein
MGIGLKMNSQNPTDTNNDSEKDLLVSRWNELTAEEVLSEAFHEIRNPIYQMLGFISVLKDTNQSPEEISRITDSLFYQVMRSKYIVDSVNDYINTRQK